MLRHLHMYAIGAELQLAVTTPKGGARAPHGLPRSNGMKKKNHALHLVGWVELRDSLTALGKIADWVVYQVP